MIKKSSAQIAVLLTLIIAAIFLFIAITINIGRVSQKKTILSNACDGATLSLASQLGSYAHMLSQKYLGGKDEKCEFDWGFFFSLLIIVILIAISIICWPCASWALYAVGATLAVAGFVINYAIVEPAMFDSMNRQFKKMSTQMRLQEQTIMYAFQNTIDDPVTIVDVHDSDEDGLTDDKVSRFWAWYKERLIWINNTYTPRVHSCINSFMPQMYDFYEKAANQSTTTSSGETTETVRTDFKTFLNDTFIPLLSDIESCGYSVSFWQPGEENDEVDEMLFEIEDFEEWFNALYEVGEDGWVSTIETWSKHLYDTDDTDDWYDVVGNWQTMIGNWISELEDLDRRVNKCIQDCQVYDPETGLYYCSGCCCCNLQGRISSAISKLEEFNSEIGSFRGSILGFISCLDNIGTSRLSTYSWLDSLGHHHVKVDVAPFSLPYIKAYRSWFKKCAKLKNKSGYAQVTITRYDQDTQALFGNRSLLWRFRYRKNPESADVVDPSNADSALSVGITADAKAYWIYTSQKAKLVN